MKLLKGPLLILASIALLVACSNSTTPAVPGGAFPAGSYLLLDAGGTGCSSAAYLFSNGKQTTFADTKTLEGATVAAAGSNQIYFASQIGLIFSLANKNQAYAGLAAHPPYSPVALAVDAKGNLIVLDSNGGGVLDSKKNPLHTGSPRIWIVQPNGSVNQLLVPVALSLPTGLAVDGNGTIWITDSQSGVFMVTTVSGKYQVKQVMPSGGASAKNGSTPAVAAQKFVSVAGISNGGSVVLDGSRGQLWTFDSNGKSSSLASGNWLVGATSVTHTNNGYLVANPTAKTLTEISSGGKTSAVGAQGVCSPTTVISV